jgi:DNA-binding MarR family transcriptional regulator
LSACPRQPDKRGTKLSQGKTPLGLQWYVPSEKGQICRGSLGIGQRDVLRIYWLKVNPRAKRGIRQSKNRFWEWRATENKHDSGSFTDKENSMENQDLLDLNFKMWILIGDLHHNMVLVRQKELDKYNISTRQLRILRLIEGLGPEARLSEIAKILQRKIDVVSRQAVMMEKDGLIKRIRDKPKSRLLRLELTKKGQELLNNIHRSKGMNEVLSVLTEKERQEIYSALNRVMTKLNKYSAEEHED